MTKIHLERKTTLLVGKIKENANNFIEESLEKYRKHVSNLKKDWRGNNLFFSFEVKGFSISGTVATEDNLIKVEAEVPFIAKNKIKRMLSERLEELFP